MTCALWLNRCKVYRASEISENLDVASLRGYFLAGSLVEWLRANGGEEYANELSRLSPDDGELNEKLAAVFGGEPLPAKPLGAGDELPFVAAEPTAPFSSAMSSHPLSSFTESFSISWQFTPTGSFGSFSERLFALFSREYGSFGLGSRTSFHEWEWEWLYKLFGGYGSFGSFSFGSFGSFTINWLNEFFGSFSPNASFPILPELDEYDRIMLETLLNCPLDRFGYGIHNI